MVAKAEKGPGKPRGGPRPEPTRSLAFRGTPAYAAALDALAARVGAADRNELLERAAAALAAGVDMTLPPRLAPQRPGPGKAPPDAGASPRAVQARLDAEEWELCGRIAAALDLPDRGAAISRAAWHSTALDLTAAAPAVPASSRPGRKYAPGPMELAMIEQAASDLGITRGEAERRAVRALARSLGLGG